MNKLTVDLENKDQKTLTPAERARLRAKEILAMFPETDGSYFNDKFYIDPMKVPDGWTYEWRRHDIYGKLDPAYEVQLAQEGWQPVPTSRHPDLMPIGSKSEIIYRDGLCLFERPAIVTAEFRRRERKEADDLIKIKEEGLHHAVDAEVSRKGTGVRRSFDRIPDDAMTTRGNSDDIY